MQDDEPRSRRRWWLAGGAVLVLVVVAVAVVVLRTFVFRDRARVVSTDEALDRFRTQASSVPVTTPPVATTLVAPAVSTLPATTSTPLTAPARSASSTAAATPEPVALVAPGVYRYATTGQEHVDALNGAAHTYPAETTITVVPDGCGVSLRWDALEERWDEWQLCATADGVWLQTDGIQYHEFFGQPDDEAVACTAAVILVPAVIGETAPVQQACTLADDPWTPVWTILERAPRTVDDRQVDVQHVRMQIEDDDEYWEHTTIDWYLALDGLPVQVVATKSSLSPSPIGDVQYDEHFQLDLVSLTPLR